MTAVRIGAAVTVSQARQGHCRANVAMHKEARRFDIELFAPVFADLDQIMIALAAGA